MNEEKKEPKDLLKDFMDAFRIQKIFERVRRGEITREDYKEQKEQIIHDDHQSPSDQVPPKPTE